MSTKWVAYYRVSTKRQGLSGLGLEAQQEAVRRFVSDGELVAEFEEVESGKRDDRPALEAALRECRLRGAVLLIAKLDRLSRSVSFLSRLMDDSGVEFRAVDMPEANRFMLHIMAAMAEHERIMISQRTKAALKAAKDRGVRLGGCRPGHSIADYADIGRGRSSLVRTAKSRQRAGEIGELIDRLRLEGITSFSGLARELNQRSISTPRGKEWSAGQVRRTLAIGMPLPAARGLAGADC